MKNSKRKVDQTKILKPAKMSGANTVTVIKLDCKTSVSCNFVGVVAEFQNTKFIHDWPDKLNYPYGR